MIDDGMVRVQKILRQKVITSKLKITLDPGLKTLLLT